MLKLARANEDSSLTTGRIFKFWYPLALTWLMMAIESPFIAAVIARLPNSKENLAAYGVAFAFALIIEAPVIMMLSAATALVDRKANYLKVRNFTYFLNGLLTVLMLVLLIPPIFNTVMVRLIHLPPNIAHLTAWALLLLLPWPGAIGYRRLFQGILIRYERTRMVAYGTAVRVVAMASTAIILARWTNLPGAAVGASAHAAGVVAEALASRIMAYSIVRQLLQEDDPEPGYSYRYIVQFYYPLALTALLGLATQPVATFFMGRARMPIESLAVLPVINALIFIFRSLGLSYQEVVIAVLGDKGRNYPQVRRFAWYLAAGISLSLGIIVFTPLLEVWYHNVSGLSPELTQFAKLPTRILYLMPVLTLLISYQRAVLVHARHTHPISWASTIEIVGLAGILFVAISLFHMVGAIAAAMGFVLARLMANGYLYFPVRWVVRTVYGFSPVRH